MFALTGALIAIKRGFDPVGVSIITIIGGAGGGIIRDAVFLNIEPAAIRDWRYSAVLFAVFAFVILARSLLSTRPIAYLIIATEALGIGINSVYGTQRALDAKTSIYAAVIVGLINATGGRLMRDTVIGKKRKSLMPSRLYGIAAFASIGLFLAMTEYFDVRADIAAWSAIILAFLVRMTAIKFDIKTKALVDYYDPSAAIVNVVSDVVRPRIPKTYTWKNRQKPSR